VGKKNLIKAITHTLKRPMVRFFPGRGRALGRISDPNALPLKPGKNKGAEVMVGVVPAISARFHIGLSRSIQNVYQSKAVLFTAIFRSVGGFRPPPSVGSRAYHA
jgi:hypothetical protein